MGGKGKGKEHVLLVVFPAQGHISPALQLAFKIVEQSSIDLTFLTSSSAVASILIKIKPPGPGAFNFAAFSQGNHNDDDAKKDYMHTLRKHGSQSVRDIIHSASLGEGGHPITRILYTTLLPWAAEVAREFHLPSVLLWTQPVTTLLTFHYYFSGGYEDAINKVCKYGTDDDSTIQLPRLPLLSSRDFHSFMLPSNPFKGAINTFKEHLEALDAEENPTLLVNTYDALEEEALQAMIPKYKTMGIGPLIPSSVFDTRETTCEVVSLVPDLVQKSKDCYGWLNSKAEGSVIYVSFGSHVKRSKAQTEEIAKGLLASGHPFLWVITSNEEEEEGDEIMEQNLVEEIQEKGMMIVPWCAQLQVLKHLSVGCFMTHCGWNSTLESIACGVPMIGFPKMFDQPTISKLIAHVWKVGVRVNAADHPDGIVGQEVIKNCIKSVMDPDGIGRELNENVRKFMSLGKKAAEEGGSSHNNFTAFVQDMTRGSTTIN